MEQSRRKYQLKIDDVSEKFIKNIFKNKSYKQDIKYDIKNLDKEINSLNLLNGIEEEKQKEIIKLIDQKREETKNQILNLSNNLLNWPEIKNNQINKGKEIMNQKIESNLGTKDLNQIIGILLNEVKNYPRYCDLLKTNEHYNQVFNELRPIAEQLGKNYINKKNKEEKEMREKLENEKKIKELLEKAKREEQKRIQLEKEIEERKRQEEKRKKEEEERRKREEEERRRQEEERRRQEEERIRREQEERRRAQYFPGTNYGGCSIVDGLKSIGADSSYNYRCSIAARNGIGGYVGSPAQNTHMLNLLKSGNLLRP